jgi:outer membrane protein assembly factor BamB
MSICTSKNKILSLVVVILTCLGCKKPDTSNNNVNNNIVKVYTPTTPNTQHISVLTQHNDNTRAGLNNQEKILTTANVNSAQFGLLFTLTVDDQVYAQPLVVGNLPIASGNHNVVFVATVNNTVYAYDGDDGKLYWKQNFTVAGMRPPSGSDMNSSWCNPYNDFTSNIGIASTPVIDSAAQTMYFVARSTDGSNFVQYLHAVNILTGSEQAGSPIKIAANTNGTGDGSVNGVVSFDPRRNNQRQALTLVNGIVYVTFSSHCDWNPYHGWILGYNSKTLQQQIVYNDTPNGEEGGLWESGMGMAADAQGNLYEVSGNGTVGTSTSYYQVPSGTAENTASTNPADLTNRAESALKLTPSGSTLQVTSFFTPSNYLDLNINDLDYGVMGAFLIPNSNCYLTGCKDGNLYLLNKDNMGGYSNSSNAVLQTIPLNVTMHCQPSYYKGSLNEFVYVWAENDQLRALSFNHSGSIFANYQIVSPDKGPGGQTGADLSVSSNGTVSGTGILWAAYATSGDGTGPNPGILRAFDANDITKELWNSDANYKDAVGYYAKFSSPTVADGHVYLATFSKQVVVYGLK